MTFRFRDIPEEFIFGVALTESGSDQRHTGFIFKYENEYRICHLCWHHELKNEKFTSNEYLCDSLKLEDVNLKYLASAVSSMTNINACSIPYGLRMPIQVFDGKNVYVGNVNGEGLTCSTFILSVLEKNAFFVLDQNTWAIREDDKLWQDKIIHYLSRTQNVEAEHLEAAKRLIGKVVRFRPEEVFSCASADPEKWAIEFLEAEAIAADILEKLKSA